MKNKVGVIVIMVMDDLDIINL